MLRCFYGCAVSMATPFNADAVSMAAPFNADAVYMFGSHRFAV